jgi:predicted site-specific integrase-resolvase
MSESQYYKISKAAKKLGVAAQTLRRWESEGIINAIRTPGGQRLIDLSSVCPEAIVQQQNKESGRVVVYARVSSSKQRDDLQRQKEYLLEHHAVKSARREDVIEVSDVGSGLNFKRPGLLRVLGLVKSGCVSKIVVASRDRMARFGFELIEWLCNEYGTKILVLDNQDSTPEEELGKDLMSIVQVYCCRWNGRRRYINKGNKDSEVATSPDGSTEENSE